MYSCHNAYSSRFGSVLKIIYSQAYFNDEIWLCYRGMGYALLGNVPPVIGIYMAFFPVLIYVFLGTSHHISLGKFMPDFGLDLM